MALDKNDLKKIKLISYHDDLYKVELDNFSRLTFFDELSKEDIRYLIKKYKIKLSVLEIENLKKYFKKFSPTILELKAIAQYWNSGHSVLDKSIDQVEVETNNKYIIETLDKISQSNKIKKDNQPFSINKIFEIISDEMKQKGIDSGIYINKTNYLKCSAYTKNEKILCYLGCVTRFSSNDNLSIVHSALKTLNQDFLPLYSYRTSLNRGEYYDIYNFGSYATLLGISSGINVSITDDKKVNNFEATSTIGFRKHMINHENLMSGSKILYVFDDNQNEHEIQNQIIKLINEGFFKKNNASVFFNNDSLMTSLIKKTNGFNIQIDPLIALNIDWENVLFGKSTNCIFAIVGNKNYEDFYISLSLLGYKYFEIGTLKTNNQYEISQNNTTFFSLNKNLVRFKSTEFVLAQVNEFPEEIIKKKIGINFRELALKSIKETAIKDDIYILNGSYSGNTINSKYEGIMQMSPSQTIDMYADYCTIQDFKVGISHSNFDDNNNQTFIKTINCLTNTMLKLMVKGYPIHQIIIDTMMINNKEDKDVETGEYLSMALALYYFQSMTSIPLMIPNICITNERIDKNLVLTSGIGYTNGKIIRNIFLPGDKLFKVHISVDKHGMPDFKSIIKLSSILAINMEVGNITAGVVVERDTVNSIIMHTIGDGSGFSFSKMEKSFFEKAVHEVIIAIKEISELPSLDLEYLGVVDNSGIIRSVDFQITKDDILSILNKQLIKPKGKNILPDIKSKKAIKLINKYPNTEPPVALIISFDIASINIYSEILRTVGFTIIIERIQPNDIINENIVRSFRDKITNSNIILIVGDIPWSESHFFDKLMLLLKTPSILDAINEMLFSQNALMFSSGVGTRCLLGLGFLTMGTSESEPIHMEKNIYNSFTNKTTRIKLINNKNIWLKDISSAPIVVSPLNEYSRIVFSSGLINQLAKRGQIIAQFIDENNDVTDNYPYNFSGSSKGIAALVSPNSQIIGFTPSIEKTIRVDKNKVFLENIFTNAYNFLYSNNDEEFIDFNKR